ncbi:MAG: ATP-grasp domain-containing protein [Pseudomonadales bacterium]
MSNVPCPIVLVGPEQDEHIQAIARRIDDAGRDFLLLDPAAFPASLHISLGEDMEAIFIDGKLVNRPAAVYLRSLQQSPIAYGNTSEQRMQENWRRTLITFQERNTLLTAIMFRWEQLGVPVYNAFSVQQHITKPLQLSLLQQAGLPVPRTLWTNNPDEVLRFAKLGPAIYKPVTGGASTRELTEADLAPERLSQLAISPVTFQELLPGDDIRVFLLDGKIIARYKIVTDAIDFRQNEIAINNIDLPDQVEAQCVRACQVIGLRFTGMDLKYDAEGEAKILELNASPMFLGFDAMAGTDIAGDLVAALLTH